MKRLLALFALPALLCAAPALAQSTYPTAAGGRAAGVVPLQCDTNGANCVPAGTAGAPAAGAQQVQGNVADAAADSGNTVKVGGRFNTSPPNYTDGLRGPLQLDNRGNLNVALAVPGTPFYFGSTAMSADGNSGVINSLNSATYSLVFNGATWDRARGDFNGQVVQPALSSTFWQYAAASGGIVSSTADVAIKAAAGASVRNYLCTLDISHDTLSAASEIVVKDGATVVWRGRLQTAAADISAGAGKLVFTPCLRGTANTAMNVAMITSVTGGVYVNATGYTGS